MGYKVLREGSGEKSPLAGTTCECHYAGTTPSLTPDAIEKEESEWSEFDSSYKRGSPTSFAPNQVIKGWTEAMQLMGKVTSGKCTFHQSLDMEMVAPVRRSKAVTCSSSTWRSSKSTVLPRMQSDAMLRL